MSDRLIKQMMPDDKIRKIDLHEGIFTYCTLHLNHFHTIYSYNLCISWYYQN